MMYIYIYVCIDFFMGYSWGHHFASGKLMKLWGYQWFPIIKDLQDLKGGFVCGWFDNPVILTCVGPPSGLLPMYLDASMVIQSQNSISPQLRGESSHFAAAHWLWSSPWLWGSSSNESSVACQFVRFREQHSMLRGSSHWLTSQVKSPMPGELASGQTHSNMAMDNPSSTSGIPQPPTKISRFGPLDLLLKLLLHLLPQKKKVDDQVDE